MKLLIILVVATLATVYGLPYDSRSPILDLPNFDLPRPELNEILRRQASIQNATVSLMGLN